MDDGPYPPTVTKGGQGGHGTPPRDIPKNNPNCLWVSMVPRSGGGGGRGSDLGRIESFKSSESSINK